MNFQVPQFIEQKPKIVGFLNLPQFLYLAAAAGISFACFYIFDFFLWLLITGFVGIIAVAFAFVKVNGQDFVKVAGAALGFLTKPRTFTWQRAVQNTSLNTESIEKLETLRRRMSFEDKLKSLALAVSTGKIFSGLGTGSQKEGEEKEKTQTVTYLTGEKKVAKRIDYR